MSNKLSAKKWMKDQGYQKVMTISLDTLELILNQWDQSKAKAALKEDGWVDVATLPEINNKWGESELLMCWDADFPQSFVGWYSKSFGWRVAHYRASSMKVNVSHYRTLPQPPTQRVIEGL